MAKDIYVLGKKKKKNDGNTFNLCAVCALLKHKVI